jgi:hypothetical protein
MKSNAGCLSEGRGGLRIPSLPPCFRTCSEGVLQPLHHVPPEGRLRLQVHQDIGQVLGLRPFVHLTDRVGPDLGRSGKDPEELPSGAGREPGEAGLGPGGRRGQGSITGRLRLARPIRGHPPKRPYVIACED